MTTPAPPVRFCPVCKTADDHPRHDIANTDPLVAPHMDCCAEKGCPDGTCNIQVRAKGDKTGDEFRKQLTSSAFAEKSLKLLEERDHATAFFTHDDIDPAVHGAIVSGPTVLKGAG